MKGKTSNEVPAEPEPAIQVDPEPNGQHSDNGKETEYPDHPDRFWTCRRMGGETWKAVAHWPRGESLPHAGEKITVHRRDGSTSLKTIHEVEGIRHLASGRDLLYCTVE